MDYSTRATGTARVVTGTGREAHDYVCDIDHCTAEVADGVSIALCTNHLRNAWAAYQITQGAEVPEAGREEVVDVRGRNTPGVVYMVRVGDLLKIGWSRNIKRRFNSLQPDAVLHFQQGTKEDESAMHAKFSAHLVKGREWFECNDETMRLVEDIRTARVAA